MAAESFESRLRMVEQAVMDNSEVRERGKRNERELVELRQELGQQVSELRGEVRDLSDELRSMYRAFVTAAISFVLAAAGIITTLVALFR
jgi:ElaB/YqjD/DUF883 family membrane-anchored ribosome-binding protein